MTRETKIGLLVGLAFLIVLGVLISDHVITSTDARPAQVADAGAIARDALTIPGGTNPHNGTPVTPGDITPAGPVQTKVEVDRTSTGSSSVVVGPSSRNPLQITGGGNANNDVPLTAQPQPISPDNAEPLVMDPSGGTRVTIGQQAPVIVPADTTSAAHDPVSNLVGPESGSTSVTAGAKEYRAVAGDTVAKMAKRFYGADTKANRDLIINANPSLKADSRKVVLNKTYSIPKKANATETAAVVGPTTIPSARTETVVSDRTYTVKAGDNIWKIAKDQLKDLNAVTEIRKLNTDVLRNGDNLKVGMKLRLPAKKG